MIELLHSYQYIDKDKKELTINNNNIIVNKNMNSILGLLNMPKNKDIFQTKIVKIKTKKKSLKLNRKVTNKTFINNFSNLTNTKIIVNIDENKLNQFIKINNTLPDKNEFFKLLNRNLKSNISYHENILNLIKKVNYFHEYSWYLECENISKEISYLPHYIYKLKNNFIDIYNEKIYKNDRDIKIKFKLKGGIIFGDNIENNNLFNLIKKNSYDPHNQLTIIITNNTKHWQKLCKKNLISLETNSKNIKTPGCYILNINNINNYFNFNNKYHRVIFDDSIDKKSKNIDLLKKIKAKKKWFITSKTFILKFNDLLNICDLLFDYKLTLYDKDLIQDLSSFYIRNSVLRYNSLNFNKKKINLTHSEKLFYKKYCKDDDIKLYFSLPLNKMNIRYTNGLNKNINNEKCSICLETIKDDNKGITKCNHHFCYNCIYKHTSQNSSCPICRKKINFDNIYLVLSKNNSINDSKLPSKINYILNSINDQNICILSKYTKSIESLTKFFMDMNIKFNHIDTFNNENIQIGTYENLNKYNLNIKNIDSIILLEPLSNSYEDQYFKTILFNNFYNKKIEVLISKNTCEEYI